MASVCSRFCQANVTMDKNPPKVALEDCICPICMCILIEPVTMPCQHELCMPCFKQNVEEASLTCPMCRTRISVWARHAARTRTLVNEVRWTQIRSLFPLKVQRRLEGTDDDSSDEVFNISKPQIAEPGEIRKEYEEQMQKLREQYVKERQREHEASQRLIQQLQAEEDKKRAEQKHSLRLLEEQDHDLAQELDHVMNNNTTDLLMQESQKRTTRSISSNSNEERPQEPGTLHGFLDRIRQKSQSKVTDPYPFACFTPSQKDGGSSQRASTSISGLFADKNYVRPETITLSSSSSSLQDMFTPVSSVPPASESTRNTPTDYGQKHSDMITGSTVSIQSVCPKTTSTSTSHSLLGDILSAQSPVPSSSSAVSRHISNITNLKSGHVIGGEKLRDLSTGRRCTSTESTDSISPETCHFKPIQCCPLTPPRKVNGKVVKAPIIFTTPRKLNKLELSFSPTNTKHIVELSEKSPVIKNRLRILAEDRKRCVEANSKSTSTDNGNKIDMSHLNMLKSARLSPTTHPSMVKPTAKPKNSIVLSMKPVNSKASYTISSQTQLDENCNESPCSSSDKKACGSSSKRYKQKGATKRLHSPQIGSGDSAGKPLLPLVSCIDELDELDGSPPLPESYYPGKPSSLNSSQDSWNLFDDTLPHSSPIKSTPQPVSRDLFHVQRDQIPEKGLDGSLKCTLTYSKHKRTNNLKRSKKTSSKVEIKSPQLSLKDMFQRIQKRSPKDCVSPGFNSASSTPSVDEGTVHVKSLIDKAISSLDEDAIADKLPCHTFVNEESKKSDLIKNRLHHELHVHNKTTLSKTTTSQSVEPKQHDRPATNQPKLTSREKKRQQVLIKPKKQKKNIKVSSPPNTLDKFVQNLDKNTAVSTDATIHLTSSGRKRRRPRRFGDDDDEDDVSLSFVKKSDKSIKDIEDSKAAVHETFTHTSVRKCGFTADSSMSDNKLRKTQAVPLTKHKGNAKETIISPIKTVQCSSSSRLSKKRKGKLECDSITQEELDRSIALKLQKQFDSEARQEARVDRRKGSTDEYSLRKRNLKTK